MNRDDRKPRKPHAITRRSFIKGAGAVAAAAGLVRVGPASADEKTLPPGVVEQLGPYATTIELNINGKPATLEIEPRVTLLRALREHLGLTGSKLVCDRGACGACTVHLDSKPVPSCMVLAIDARGHQVTTIEGLGTPANMHPVQAAFVEEDAQQCGFCTPGMVMSVAAALQRNPAATTDEIKHATAGNTAAAVLIRMSSRPLSNPSSRACDQGHLMSRRVTLKLGFQGNTQDVAVVIPDDEPTPWDWGERLSVVGKPTPRVDGPLKATGAAHYTYDIELPGMLYGAILRSPWPHARIRNIDLSAAQHLDGVRAVFALDDREIRFAGQEVAAVAATSSDIAADALKLIKVDYETLPFVVDMESAAKDSAPRVFGSGSNVGRTKHSNVGDVPKGSRLRRTRSRLRTPRRCRPTSASKHTARSRASTRQAISSRSGARRRAYFQYETILQCTSACRRRACAWSANILAAVSDRNLVRRPK